MKKWGANQAIILQFEIKKWGVKEKMAYTASVIVQM
jgi:hypothetical protein